MATEVFEEDVMGLITIALIDKSRFKFAFKSTTSSPELVKLVCEKVGVRQSNYFGLKRLRNPRTEVDEDIAQKVWVAEKAPLFSQGCDSSTTLFLRHKYWFLDAEELHDVNTIQLIFEETDRKLMSDKYPASDDINIQLAACRIQIAHGDCQPGTLYVTEETIRYLIPHYIQEMHSLEDWSRLVEVFHKKLAGKNKQEVQRVYLNLAREHVRQLTVTFFPSTFSTREMKKKVKIMVGVSPEGVGIYALKQERRMLQLFYRFRDLQNWQLNPLWNGMEAPDHERSKLPPLEQELQEFLTGPFRVAFFLKTKSKRTKDLEVEISSFVQEDDTAIMFMNTYNQRFEQYVNLLELDEAKESMLTVSTLDGVTKKVRVLPETSGQDLINMVAEKINLQDTQYFHLSVVTDDCDRWLTLKEPVTLQGCSSTSNIVLKLRFFAKDPQDVTDPVARTLYFLQVRQSVIAGDIPVSEEDAIELAAFYLQTVVGPFEKKKQRAGFLQAQIEEYIPFYLVGFKSRSWWEKKINQAHERLRDVAVAEVQFMYLKLVAALPNFGLSYYNAIIPKTEEECLIGVGKQGIALFKAENMKLIASYRFGYELRGYSNDGEAIHFKVKVTRNAEERVVVVVSLLFAEIIDLIGYYDKMRKFEKKIAPQTEEGSPVM